MSTYMEIRSSTSDWQLPSPSTTPQSAIFNGVQFETSATPDLSWMPSQPSARIINAQTAFYNPTDNAERQLDTSLLKRRRPVSSAYSGDDGQIKTSSDAYPASESYHYSTSPMHSFLDQFDGANLQDTSFNQSINFSTFTPSSQMQTPPPTRDASAPRRKPQQARMFPTGISSTTVSRPISAPGDSWLRRCAVGNHLEASPLEFNAMHFAPPELRQPVQPGPIESVNAHAHSQLASFWNSNDTQDPHTRSIPVAAGDKPSSQLQNLQTSFEHNQHPLVSSQSYPTFPITADAVQATRPGPQSARPIDAKRPATYGSIVPTLGSIASSSVNPSLLSTSSGRDPLASSKSDRTVADTSARVRQPYQYQHEQLKREKEQERLRRASKAGSQLSKDSASLKNEAKLRRNVTESKHHTIKSNTNFTRQTTLPSTQEVNHQADKKGLPRTSVQLKRHKSDMNASALRNVTSSGRKSVILTVDQRGRARTEVKAIMEDTQCESQDNRSLRVEDDEGDTSEASASPERPHPSGNFLLTGSDAGQHIALGRGNAQEALAEVVRDRRQRRLEQPTQGNNRDNPKIVPADVSSYQIPASTLPNDHHYSTHWDNISPTTITDPDLETPMIDRLRQFNDGVRCICNQPIDDSNQLMVQCDFCAKWLHAVCVGINQQLVPPTFVCMYCRRDSVAVLPNTIQGFPSAPSSHAQQSYNYR